MKKSITFNIYLILFGLFIHSCSVKKYLPEDEKLYRGAEIEIETETPIDNIEALKTELEATLRPEPNSKFLGMYLGLYYHFKAQKENPGFINRWLNKKIGEKPVYQSDVETFEVEDILRNRLENKGFFYSTAASTFEEKETEATVNYELSIAEPYKMETYQLDSMPSPIHDAIKQEIKNHHFKKGLILIYHT